MSITEITKLLCKIVGIQTDIIKRQSDLLAAFDVYDEKTELLFDKLERAEKTLRKQVGK